MLESLNYSFRNPKNIIWVIYRIKQLRNYKKNHRVLRGPQLGKQHWRARLGILRVNLGARWGWVVNVTPRPFYPREWPGGPQNRSGLVRKLWLPPEFDPQTVQPVYHLLSPGPYVFSRLFKTFNSNFRIHYHNYHNNHLKNFRIQGDVPCTPNLLRLLLLLVDELKIFCVSSVNLCTLFYFKVAHPRCVSN